MQNRPSSLTPTNALTEGAITKTMFFFTLPILMSNVVQTMNGSINAMWIGRYLGEAALTAAANANSIMFLLIGVMFGFGMATTILVGQSLGAKNIDQAKRIIGTSATFFALFAVLVATAGFFGSPLMLHAMHTPADALPFANAYLRMIFAGIPFMFLFTFVMMCLRGAGDSKTPFWFLLLAVCLDLVLNPLLIFGWGPLAGLGVAGSALATLLGQLLSLILLVGYLYRSKHFLRLQGPELRYLRFDPVVFRTLITKGVPMGMQIVVVSTGMIFMISLVNRFGSEAAAGYGASLQLWNYIQMPAFAIGQAVSSMAAQNIGARQWARVDRVAIVGVVFSLVLSGVLVSAVYTFMKTAVGIFIHSPQAMAMGRRINTIAVWSFLFFGVSLVLMGVVRAAGAVMAPLVILIISLWGVRFPFAYLLLDRWQSDAIWWSFPLGSLVSLILTITYYRVGTWKRGRMS